MKINCLKKYSLSNKNADECAEKLYEYLCSVYGNKILSGQQLSEKDGVTDEEELKKIKRVTGKTPAIFGLDFMDYSLARKEFGAVSYVTEKALEYSSMGGIITISWHWNAPNIYLKSTETSSEGWWGGFYTENTDLTKMNLGKMLDGEDKYGYNFLLDNIDAVAVQLKILRDNNVPVLFRPLHEGSGGWFWWGAFGRENYIRLWKLMYNRLTDYHKLNNIIWVFNGQDKSWYPGDNYVDIIGEDIYPGQKIYTPQVERFRLASTYSTDGKPIAMSENGCLFDIDKAFETNVPWLWFCTWCNEFAVTNDYTEEEMWIKVYNHPKVITLEDLK